MPSPSAITKGNEHAPVPEDVALARSKCPSSALPISVRNVFTPARRSRSASDDASQSLPAPKRQRSILDFWGSAKVDLAQSTPKQQKSLFDFFRKPTLLETPQF